MATATLLSGPTTDTGNTPNSSGSFTPTLNDLLVVIVTKEASALSSPIVSADLSCSAGTTFTLVRTQGFGASAHQLAVFVANAKSAASSQTVTLASGADAGGGTIIAVYGIAGMTFTGSSAIRQSGGETDQASGEVPSLNFGTGVALTGNLIIGTVGVVDNTPGLLAPASFQAVSEAGYTTGATQGISNTYRNSGHTSQTVAWQTNTTGGSYATIIVELDTSTGTSYTDRRLGQIDLTGTRRETHRYTERRSGQIDATGARRESNSRTNKPTGQITLSGTVSEDYLVPVTYTDKPSGTISLLGSRRESLSHTDGLGAGAFDPSSLSGFWAWFDASTIAGSDGDPVASWSDLGGGAPLTQGTGDGQPTLQTNEVNGLPIVRFDGSDDFMNRANDVVDARHMFAVLRIPEATFTNGWAALIGSPTGGPAWLASDPGSTSWYDTLVPHTYRVNGVDEGAPPDPAPMNTVALNVFESTSGSGHWYVLDLQVGRDRNITSRTLKVDVAEILLFTAQLSTADRDATENYLLYKWGLGGTAPGAGALITLSGTVSEQNFTAVTYTERVTGTISISGASREQSSQTAKSTGTILLSGQASDQYTIIVTNTDSPAGQITLSGTLSDEFVGAITDSFTGQILLSGAVRESQATSYRVTGQITLSGSVRESWALGYTDRRSGQIDISGTVSEQYLLATVDRATGTITLTGAARESSSQTSKGTGTIILSGSLSDRYVGATTDLVTGQITLTGAIREQYLSATTDRVTGTITLSGATRESHAVSRTEKIIGTVQVTGTLTDSFQISGGTQTVTPTGTITLSGTRRESQSRSDRATGTITISGTASDSWSLGYTDRVSGTISLSGAIREQYTAATVDRASGVISLSGTWRESSSQRVLRTGTITVTGTVSEQYLGATTDRRSGQITISGTQSDYWESTRTERRTGTIVISGQIWENYLPSGVTIDKRTGTIVLFGSALDIHSRWDFVDGERWPGSTEDRWQEDVGERWNLDPVA